jgi:peptidoglycan/LPS O-acetylase OafA/YrhL
VTLARAFDLKSNSLNLLRVLLAACVIVSHSWPIGGFGRDPEIGGTALGEWGVIGFFIISGYLITSSRLRMAMGPFLLRRAARILPGFWVCLVAVAFVAAPLAALASGDPYSLTSGASYVLRNADLWISRPGIASTLRGVPYAGPDGLGPWNGSLWTLSYEFACYVGAGVLLWWGVARRTPAVTAALWVLATLADVATHHVHVPAPVANLSFLGSCFLAGALLRMYAHRIPFSGRHATAALVILAVVAAADQVATVGALPFAYLLLWVSVRAPFHRFGSRYDVSYGLYIYAFPVQELLARAGLQRAGVGAFVAASAVLTVAPAWLSWVCVERPAKDWSARWITRRRAGLPLRATAEPAAASAPL